MNKRFIDHAIVHIHHTNLKKQASFMRATSQRFFFETNCALFLKNKGVSAKLAEIGETVLTG